ncbi:type VII secretion target [Nocardia flavorosea]|uniref:Excreted virulence factor EspC (Type VII ESX diderm) n=1 Tax=Nocardia flavorosea TaxID=53429 RepID=A0A846YL86_9NOCA|nr:type VII secretion target [Nocardia flavorosea]NKY58354.1 hypothetical protein [Nocardia flavorosea]
MNDLSVVTDAVRRFGEVSAEMAVTAAGAGATNQSAIIAAAVPVFGVIGQDFLAAFAFAQVNNLRSVTEIAAVHAATALASYEGAAHYEGAEEASVAELTSIGVCQRDDTD